MTDKENETKSTGQQPQIVYVQQPMSMQSDDEVELDLGKVMSIFWDKRALAARLSLGLAAVFLAGSLVLPKTYESTTVVQTSAGTNLGGGAAALAALSGSSSNPVAANYIELMKSRTVLQPIIESLEYKDGIFRTAEEKKARTVADYAKWADKNLEIENTKGTNLIAIKGKGGTPEDAQRIAQAVADNFLSMQTDLNQKQQSLLLQFLNERIETSKQEAQEAEKKFAEYKREHKIYSPEEQARKAVSKMDAFDNTLANLKVQQEATKAEADAASSQLEKIGSNSRSFQINDNETVIKMREQIANKQVALVTLEQRYTEDNPQVNTAKAELEQLKSNLTKEVNDIVASKAATLNPQQADLLQKQAAAEVKNAVARISEKAVEARRKEEEEKLQSFPDDVKEYLELQREAEIKNKIYGTLVQQAETTRIEEAKESMDIQIVDPANLPLEDMPASPKKGRNTVIGFVLGLLISFGYAFYTYWKGMRAEAK